MSRINIAIDGYAGCGKSTLARDLARTIGYTFVDSGALYRGITLLVIRSDEGSMEARIDEALRHLPPMHFETSTNALYIGTENVEAHIRQTSLAQHVSEVAAHPRVREAVNQILKTFIANRGVVMEGRDIGTVVIPDAELKLFITASMEARVQRRLGQLREGGMEANAEEVAANLKHRDHMDATRDTAPLKRAADAIALDTSGLTRDEQLRCCVALMNPIVYREDLLLYV